MTENHVSWELKAFAKVPDFNRLDLPESEANSYLVAFIDKANGQHKTALMDEESADMIATCGVELGEMSASTSYFRAFRDGWPEDWDHPDDRTQWVTPQSTP